MGDLEKERVSGGRSTSERSPRRRTVLAALPPAGAIFVFGVIYGSLAQERMGVTATLFAALAAISLFDDGDLADPTTLVAAAGALGLAWTRSLLWHLAGGVLGYAVATLLR